MKLSSEKNGVAQFFVIAKLLKN